VLLGLLQLLISTGLLSFRILLFFDIVAWSNCHCFSALWLLRAVSEQDSASFCKSVIKVIKSHHCICYTETSFIKWNRLKPVFKSFNKIGWGEVVGSSDVCKWPTDRAGTNPQTGEHSSFLRVLSAAQQRSFLLWPSLVNRGHSLSLVGSRHPRRFIALAVVFSDGMEVDVAPVVAGQFEDAEVDHWGGRVLL